MSTAIATSRAVLRAASKREQALMAQVEALKDPALSALYFLLAGRNGFEDGAAVRTYPRSHRPGDVRLHREMLRLEVAGLVRRVNDDETVAEWEAVR